MIPLGRLALGALLVAGAAPEALAQGIGTAALQLGYARAVDRASGGAAGGLGVRAHLAFRAGRFTLGPEGAIDFVGDDQRVLQAGGVARVELGRAAWRPYLVGGLGSYTWKIPDRFQLDLVGASLGAGLLRRSARGPGLGLETRYHWSLQDSGGGGRRDMVTVGVGVHLGW